MLAGGDAAVDGEEGAGGEGGGVGGEEEDGFGHFGGGAYATEGEFGIFFGEIFGYGAACFRRKTFEKRIDKPGMYSAGADGIDTHAMGREVESHTLGHLRDSPLGKAIGEAGALADGGLVGSHEHGRASAGGNYVRQARLQGVDGAVEICVDNKMQLGVVDIEDGVLAVYAGVCKHAVEMPETGHCGVDGPLHGCLAARIGLEKESPVELGGEGSPGVGIDIGKSYAPARGMEAAHGGSPDSRRASGDKDCLHI